MNRYSVYILECADGTLYTGITTDVARRIAQHEKGSGARYTRAHGVRGVRYVESGMTQSKALIREAFIKRLSREEKINLIDSSNK